MDNALKALAILSDLLVAANNVNATLTALFQKAHAEGRDISDAELQQLADARHAGLAALKQQIGA